MPIQATITLPDGVSPVYHVITDTGIRQSFPLSTVSQSANASYSSWMDAAHFQSGAPSVSGGTVDISPLLGMPSPTPSGNFGPQLISIIEQYLLTLPQFAGGIQVS